MRSGPASISIPNVLCKKEGGPESHGSRPALLSAPPHWACMTVKSFPDRLVPGDRTAKSFQKWLLSADNSVKRKEKRVVSVDNSVK